MAAGWEVYPDFAGGSDYYYNTETGTVTWTRPAEFPPLDYGTYALGLSAGSRRSVRREGGGSKEVEGGTSSESEDEQYDDIATDLCKDSAEAAAASKMDTGDQTNDTKADDAADVTLAWVTPDHAQVDGHKEGKELESVWFAKEFEHDGVNVKPKWVVRIKQGGDARTVAPSALRAKEQDLTQLESLDDELVLFHLQKRFASKEIYTNIGPIVVSINPLLKKSSQQSQADQTAERGRYRTAKSVEDDTLAPHVYVTARRAYEAATQRDVDNQGIIISGQSGSGKTFATKMMLKYIMEASGTGTDDVSDKIESTNPVLEAFGNAKTRNNDNSSRFGKYLKVFLNDEGAVTGAKAEHYLLETARVVKKDDKERNYHIFYMMLAPVPAGQAAPLDLAPLGLQRDAQKYAYLKHDELQTDRQDHDDFLALRQAFRDLQFTLGAEQGVYRVLAGILHCGNVMFESQDADAAIVRQDAALQYAAKCFGVEADALVKSFCIKQGTRAEAQRTTVQAKAARDTLCKYLYGYVFDFLVHSLNAITANPGIDETRFIGCLDIFGFEKMATNSLEQLCINYTNEKLQEQFNDVTVKGEIAHLEAQDFQVPIAETVTQRRNAKAIEAIHSFMDILAQAAKEGAKSDRGTCDDATVIGLLAQKFPQVVRYKERNAFSTGVPYGNAIIVDTRDQSFQVAHYAETLTYKFEGFCAKSIDSLDRSATAMLEQSTEKFVMNLLQQIGKALTATAECGARKAGNTTGTKFVYRVCKLMEELTLVKPHYVRCVKSNNSVDKEWEFDAPFCFQQLQFAGVFQAVEIRSKGFPFKKPYGEFVSKYSCIYMERDDKLKDDRGKGDPLVGADDKAKAMTIITYVKEQMEKRIKGLSADNYHGGPSELLYRGSWHRALEALYAPAFERAFLRGALNAILKTTITTPDGAATLRNLVREAKLKRVVLDETVENQVKDKLQLFAATSLPAGTAAQLNEAIAANNKRKLAKLLKGLSDDVSEVDPVPKAFSKMCELVHLDDDLLQATTDKNEAELERALAKVDELFGKDREEYVLKHREKADRALGVIRTIKKHLDEACKDGIKAHEKAVLSATEGVVFAGTDVDEDVKCLKERKPESRRTAAINSGNFAEAARIQISIFAKYIPSDAGDVLDRYLADHPFTPDEMQRRADMNVFGDPPAKNTPPFTSTAAGVSAFQNRLLEQAALDNFDTVQAYLQGTATAQQLHDTFTSCFMNECLRDELFVAIFKASDGAITNKDRACELLQLALGHFGPSDNLRDFVHAMVHACTQEWKLVELLARRTDAANTALDRIKMTFAEFETPKYKIFEELEQVWDFLKDE